MSFSALNWAWEQRCPSGFAKSVLVCLADAANQQGGECWPTLAWIAKRTQHTEDTVRKCVKQLVSGGLLMVEARFTLRGDRTSNLYRLPVAIAPEDRSPPPLAASPPPSPQTESPTSPCTPPKPLSKPKDEPIREAPALRLAPEPDLFPTQAEPETQPEPPIGSDADPGFAAFWSSYPRKDDKGRARQAWVRARRRTPSEVIVAGLRSYGFDPNPRFVPLPSTWLNGERWLAAGEADGFDPVLRAVGLVPEDFAGPPADQWVRMLQ